MQEIMNKNQIEVHYLAISTSLPPLRFILIALFLVEYGRFMLKIIP